MASLARTELWAKSTQQRCAGPARQVSACPLVQSLAVPPRCRLTTFHLSLCSYEAGGMGQWSSHTMTEAYASGVSSTAVGGWRQYREAVCDCACRRKWHMSLSIVCVPLEMAASCELLWLAGASHKRPGLATRPPLDTLLSCGCSNFRSVFPRIEHKRATPSSCAHA